MGLNTKIIEGPVSEYTQEQRRELNQKVYESHSELFHAVLSRNPIAAARRVDSMVDLFRGQFFRTRE